MHIYTLQQVLLKTSQGLLASYELSQNNILMLHGNFATFKRTLPVRVHMVPHDKTCFHNTLACKNKIKGLAVQSGSWQNSPLLSKNTRSY